MITVATWLLRIIVGGTFIFSGFTKAVDPWGFVYKIEEYLAAWHFAQMPREAIFIVAALIALVEFTAGAMLLLGCLRRVSVWTLTAAMSLLLPLSIYIVIANPVEDCGCFGDALVISNTMTMLKNIALLALLVLLLKWNTKVNGLIVPLLQWLPALACAIFCVIVSLIGIVYQPIVDFRPYKIGTELVNHSADDGVVMIYERDGVKQEFDIDALPDSTWTYIGRKRLQAHDRRTLAIYAGDEDVTEEVVEQEGEQLILTVPNPEYHNRARSSMANHLNEYIQGRGGNMIAVVALNGESLEKWKELANPEYDVYTADGTTLKEMARGDAALIYLVDGVIQWKRDLYSLPSDFPKDDGLANQLQKVRSYDNGIAIKQLTGLLLLVIGVAWLLSLPSMVKWHLKSKKEEVKS